MNRFTALTTILVIAMALTGCSDTGTTVDLGAGGGAGDENTTNAEAIALISPLVGIYSLPANWAGEPESEAYLEITEPDINAESKALVYRVNPLQNCLESRASEGEVIKDPFTQRVFLNDLFELDNSILSRTGDTLIIDVSEDVQDVDSDGDTSEPAQLQAELFVNDLPDACQ